MKKIKMIKKKKHLNVHPGIFITIQKNGDITFDYINHEEQIIRIYNFLMHVKEACDENQNLEESIYDLTQAIIKDIKNKKYNKEKLRNSKSIQITDENVLNELYDNKFSKKKKCC